MEIQSENQNQHLHEKSCRPLHPHCPGAKLTFGVLIIVVGLLLLGFNTGYLDQSYKSLVFSWPMLLVAIGLIQMLCRHFLGGVVLMLIGGFFLLPKLDCLDQDFVKLYWPFLIIIAGVMIISKTVFFSKKKSGILTNPGFTGSEIRNGIIEENNIFSGTKRQFRNMVFRGGEINCIFGGSELDLTQAELGEGVNILEINCVFGGVSLIVPSDWTIQLKKSSIFGDFADKRQQVAEQKDNNRILIIQSSCIFGGGEIKSYL